MDIEIGPVTLTENKYGALNRAATQHEHQRDALLDLLEKIDPVAEADEARGRPKNR